MIKLKYTALGISLTLAVTAFAQPAIGADKSAISSATAKDQTVAVVAAADAFLDLLDADQRAQVQLPFNAQSIAVAARFFPEALPRKESDRPRNRAAGVFADKDKRGPEPGSATRNAPRGPRGGFVGEQYGVSIWSNFPVSDVPRPGLQFGGLNGTQRAAVLHLLKTLLSPKGYQKVLDIMGSDQALAEKGTDFASGTAYYTLGIFGTPSTTAPWMLQFGGHHLGLNVVITGIHAVLTPTLTGAQPAVYTADGKTVRALAAENDKAYELLDALDDEQRRKAILDYQVNDLVYGPGRGVKVEAPQGLKGSDMTERQRTLLLELIGEWAGMLSDKYSTPRMAEIRTGLGDTWFAWSGPTTHVPGRNGSAYFRVQGPKLIIEFAPQGVGGDPTMHVHTVYRDPTNEYGRQFTLRGNISANKK